MKRKIVWFFNKTGVNRLLRNIPHSMYFNSIKIFLIAQMIMLVFLYCLVSIMFVRNTFADDYINLLCGTEKFGSGFGEMIREIRPELETEANNVERQLIERARRMSSDNKKVLFTVINEAFLPFAYSWLCNTKTMDIHNSVLIVTTDKQSKAKLNSDWPDINVISMNMDNLSGNQSYCDVGYIKLIVKRTELIQTLLLANIDVFVFEVDCLWLANPVHGISFNERDDIIVNPVTGSNDKIFAGGFIWLRSTCRTKIIWQKVTDMMVAWEKKVEDLPVTTLLDSYKEESEQKYLARLIRDGFAGVTLKILPLELYADGQWYILTKAKRSKLRPLVINNNFIIGNEAKIDRAKKWNHWFVRDNLTCDMDLVQKTIY